MSEDVNTQYAPDAIPLILNRTIYVMYGISGFSAGKISLKDYDWSKYGDDHILLHSFPITVELPTPVDNDLKSKALAVLQSAKEKVLAENHQRLKAVQDRIDNLLAIEYKPETA